MVQNKVYTAIGMMSGTSLDGVDVALVETDGKDYTKLLDYREFPYEKSLKERVSLVFGRQDVDDDVCAAEELITQAHIDAMQETEWKADVIGFHGQTIHHDPSKRFTWQIGNPQRLADDTGIDVVADMRQADIAAGGQGAPLLPLCHRSFAADIDKPVIILNIGGVSNITWLGKAYEDILAFDTGPGNALVDDFLKMRTGQDFDQDGMLASSGIVQQALVDKWLQHSYFQEAKPKSLDRDAWNVEADIKNLSNEDGAATLTAFTVQTIAKAISMLPDKPKALYVAGGGRLNSVIMSGLSEAIGCSVLPVEEIRWNGDALEAQGFAYLAVRSLLGLDLTVPTTTGVPKSMHGGKLYKTCAQATCMP